MWQRTGTDYSIRWAGHAWQLGIPGGRPGLVRPGRFEAVLLALDGLAASGRFEEGAFRDENLASVDLFRERVEATYAPAGWDDLRVRASWSPARDGEAINLEVEVAALSVDRLRSVEVFVTSAASSGEGAVAGTTAQVVTPRDRRSACLSYDGRESGDVLRRLRTDPLPGPEAARVGPVALTSPWDDLNGAFVEMVHPDDVARRILVTEPGPDDRGGQIVAIRNGLFGYDLEKGVVLRGRLRVAWLPGHTGSVVGFEADEFARFLDVPPPLGM
jgi:hypothetical protein